MALSGSRTALLRHGPLRSVHASFDAHGSSLSKAPCGTRFHHCIFGVANDFYCNRDGVLEDHPLSLTVTAWQRQ